MSLDLAAAAQANLLSPAILFFCLGVLASLLKSDLRFPEPLYAGLTIYLLAAIGFKGGAALAQASFSTVALGLFAALMLGALIPLWCYPVLRYLGRMSQVDAAAVAAHYGSVSAVTFIAATNFLTGLGESYESYAAAFLAIMESPAILIGVILGKVGRSSAGGALAPGFGHTFREALFGRSVFVLLGALVIGALSGQRGLEATAGFFVEPFQGVLCLFLLEMGMVAARRFSDLRQAGLFLLGFGLIMPLFNGAAGILAGSWIGLSLGGTTLLAVLAASASYIAAPAAMRLSLPEANPTLYLSASLAVTFPFNITVGLPVYYAASRWWMSL